MFLSESLYLHNVSYRLHEHCTYRSIQLLSWYSSYLQPRPLSMQVHVIEFLPELIANLWLTELLSRPDRIFTLQPAANLITSVLLFIYFCFFVMGFWNFCFDSVRWQEGSGTEEYTARQIAAVVTSWHLVLVSHKETESEFQKAIHYSIICSFYKSHAP